MEERMVFSTHQAGFRIRRFVSLLVTVGFVVMLLSGVILFLTPKGWVARETDWRLLGLDKDGWIALHLTSTVLFLVSALLHVFFNWGPLVRYLRERSTHRFRLSLELVAAVLVGALFVVGTLADLPPFGWLATAREEIKHGADDECGDERGGRRGRAGRSRDAADSEDPTHDAEMDDGEHRGEGREGSGRGLGRLTLADLCDREDIALDLALTRLARQGFEADGTDRVRTLANQLGISPHEVIDRISGE
jgi:Domain of unknown function (DUF4405)